MHQRYADWVIHHLGQFIIHFQNAQPWLHFYVVHIHNMLGVPLALEDSQKMTKALSYCFS
jgi:hypothetical protein